MSNRDAHSRSVQSKKSTCSDLSRRDFLAHSGSCAAHLMLMSTAASLGAGRLFAAEAKRNIVAEAPFGRLEELSDGVWALVSTPLAKNDWTTLANGGIIAGKERVLVVESFASAEGAAWVAERAQELTGRWPTDVVLTHYHGDHTNGVAGFRKGQEQPTIWATPTTREPLIDTSGNTDGRGDQASRNKIFAATSQLDESRVTEVDLGGRTVKIHPRSGHTASDLTVELEDPNIVFYGDLLWNGIFPNFRDTTPTVFATSLRAAMRERETVYVPGHGSLADRADIERLLAVLGEVENVARKIYGTDVTVSETARSFRLPESLGEWTLFSDSYFEVAIGAWHNELAAAKR